ncbi:MAG: alpha/beta fold hydrolase [Planctomyces sp.]|nr:alpha/beta fold hydrolase [Planctomyces sp.]
MKSLSGEAIRSYTTSDGYPIQFRHWKAIAPADSSPADSLPAGSLQSHSPRAILVAAHGIQSHSGWYQYSSELLAAQGFEVYFADRRGSGLNSEDRGHAPHGDRLINDVRQLIQIARDDHPGRQLPVVLMGISWGGKIMAALAAKHPADCSQLALLYPGLEPFLRPTLFQRFQLQVARDFEIRRKPVPIPLRDPALFTDDPAAQKFIADDPLTIHTVTSGFMNAGIDLHRTLSGSQTGITCPTLVMLAGKDKIIDNQKTLALLTRLCQTSLTAELYPHACHTLEFDRDRNHIITDLTRWLNSKTQSTHHAPS